MPFYSVEYLVFIPCLFIAFYWLRDQWRPILLLAVSIWFYWMLAGPFLLVVLSVVALTTYFVALRIGRPSSGAFKKSLLIFTILLILLPLVLLRYTNFVIENINAVMTFLIPSAHVFTKWPLVRVVGASFFTFQAISYLIDVSTKVVVPEQHAGFFFQYMFFFPKVLQGPIERAEALIPQLRSKYAFDYDRVRGGLLLFSWGLFKKLIVSDRVATAVNTVYGDVHGHSASVILIATILYAFQLYSDFSGYTDMAIGTARIFNIDLSPNFRFPYLATSIADFWRRWHISLSQWLLHYIFLPLQLRLQKHKSIAAAAAVMVTFLICGVWHGPNWTFIVWGVLHGLYLILAHLTSKVRSRFRSLIGLDKHKVVRTIIQTLVTFALVCIGWIFFRSHDLGDAIYALKAIGQLVISPGSFTIDPGAIRAVMSELAVSESELILAFIGISLMVSVDIIQEYSAKWSSLTRMPAIIRWVVYYALWIGILFFGANNIVQDFVYTQF